MISRVVSSRTRGGGVVFSIQSYCAESGKGGTRPGESERMILELLLTGGKILVLSKVSVFTVIPKSIQSGF